MKSEEFAAAHDSQTNMIYINDKIDQIDLEAAMSRLSDQRREQALRFRHESGRRQSVAAYLLLCDALKKEYGITEPPLFEYGEHGKPRIAPTAQEASHRGGWEGALHFNLSHCREAVACVLSTQPVGIDIESIRHQNESLIRYTMNDAEQQLIFAAPYPDLAFTRLWTRKEAVMKLSGHGLANDMKSVLVNCPHYILTVARPDRGYVWSVATSGLLL